MEDDVFYGENHCLFGRGLLRTIFLNPKESPTIVDHCKCHVRAVRKMFHGLGDFRYRSDSIVYNVCEDSNTSITPGQ